MNLMPLVNLIEAEGFGTKGEDLFVDMLPSEAARAILLRNPLSGTPIDHEMPGRYKGDFQLIVRTPAGNYAAGETMIERLMETLFIEDRQVENLFFSYCRPRTLPAVFPLSDGNLLEFSTMFDCCFTVGK